jgi:hypothetical protein
MVEPADLEYAVWNPKKTHYLPKPAIDWSWQDPVNPRVKSTSFVTEAQLLNDCGQWSPRVYNITSGKPSPVETILEFDKDKLLVRIESYNLRDSVTSYSTVQSKTVKVSYLSVWFGLDPIYDASILEKTDLKVIVTFNCWDPAYLKVSHENFIGNSLELIPEQTMTIHNDH